VINALKHALPSGRLGRIVVSYRSQGAAWTLPVSDKWRRHADGSGERRSRSRTSIVSGLANQLRARVQLVDAEPGNKGFASSCPVGACGGRAAGRRHLVL
jgi:two-component sensor histidine kinase